MKKTNRVNPYSYVENEDKNTNCVIFESVDFGTTPPEVILVRLRTEKGGYLRIYIDSTQKKEIAVINFSESFSGKEYEATLNDTVVGYHNVYFVFEGKGFDFEKWCVE